MVQVILNAVPTLQSSAFLPPCPHLQNETKTFMSVIFVTTDLMFSSRVSGFARHQGVTLKVTDDVAKLGDEEAQKATLVLFDLTLANLDIPQQLAAIHAVSPNCQSIAFGPHVDVELLSDARDAGCTSVLVRGEFSNNIPHILAAHSDGENV